MVEELCRKLLVKKLIHLDRTEDGKAASFAAPKSRTRSGHVVPGLPSAKLFNPSSVLTLVALNQVD